MTQPTPPSPTATVRLEVRVGGGAPVVYEVGDGGFLVGSVPGCDLRVPGVNLAPVLCLIARGPGGVTLRRLAPVQAIHVNGKSVAATTLGHGDRVALAGVEMTVAVTGVVAAVPAGPGDDDGRLAEHVERLTAAAHQVRAQQDELLASRQQLEKIRQELLTRYQTRRDRLAGQIVTVRKAARKVRQRKARLDALEADVAARSESLAQRELEVQGREEGLGRDRELVEEQQRLILQKQRAVMAELERQADEQRVRDALLTEQRAALEKSQRQHQADLVRLDRVQAQLEQRQKALEQHALEVDRKYEQLQRDTRELEEQAGQLDEWHQRVTAEDERVQRERQEHDKSRSEMEQRAAALESQQTTLATLRTRLERVRDELRRQEQALSDQRALHDAGEDDLRQRLDAARQERDELAAERQVYQAEREKLAQREALMDQAVARLRSAHEGVEASQADLDRQRTELDAAATGYVQRFAALEARSTQLDQARERIESATQALADREEQLAQAEQAVATLQEHLRRRGEDLAQKLHDETTRRAQLDQREADAAERERVREEARHVAAARLEALDRDVAEREQALEKRAELVRAGEGAIVLERERLAAMSATLTTQCQALETERQQVRDEAAKLGADFERARADARDLLRLFPELETRAEAAVDRLLHARGQLREHLAELHAYAKRGREELEVARKQVQADAERVRQQELDVEAARDEHRLAVAGFRQQMIDWQGQLGEMRKALARGEVDLDRKAAEVQEQAAQVATSSARLAEQAERLEQQERDVRHQRGEVDRHLTDMQRWYRRKLRELAGVDGRVSSGAYVVPMAADDDPAVLSIATPAEPADQHLGDLLRSLDLIDPETLDALLRQARRERRSLRQVLLAGHYLTLYQMALIEAGNLDGLILGPARVIDRLQATARETRYHVYDPRRNQDVLLRHLAEGEMDDAVRPDEYRQRFAALADVRHPHVTAVYEVLEIAGRPAVLQELLHGLGSGDWPALSSAPGVLYRLVVQAAAALQAAHAAGLVHGRLTPAAWVLTTDGALKLTGLGEPAWLTAGAVPVEDATPADDLLALGEIAQGWAATMGKGKGKGLPATLQAVLARLADPEEGKGYPSAAELLAALEGLGDDVPANPTAWERFVKQVRDQADDHTLRRTA